MLERGILGESNFYPATDNRYDFLSSAIVVPFGGFVMGFIQGWIEVLWMKKLFINKPFWSKILFKGAFYLLMIIIFLVVLTFAINAIRYDSGLLSQEVIDSVLQFVSAFAFWSIVLYIAVIVDLALFFFEIKDFVGGNVYYNYSFGKYHKPKIENRIFMFLDMKSSTTIAEQMGHAKYFELIKSYYEDMTDAILETSGEVYQYVGDEIVVSWTEEKGLFEDNCIRCYQKINESIQNESNKYQSRFGFVPGFKAGLHLGEVTTGEIGTLKKEIVYSGDVLNTAARIQALCNQYKARILISDGLKKRLSAEEDFYISEIGILELRGKSNPMPIYRVEFED